MNLDGILSELKAERKRLDSAIAALEGIGGNKASRGRAAGTSAAPRKRRRNRMSAAGRRRISEMMKKRWADRRRKLKAA